MLQSSAWIMPKDGNNKRRTTLQIVHPETYSTNVFHSNFIIPSLCPNSNFIITTFYPNSTP